MALLVSRWIAWVLNSSLDSKSSLLLPQLLVSALACLKVSLLYGCRNLIWKCRMSPRPYLSCQEKWNHPFLVKGCPQVKWLPGLTTEAGYLAVYCQTTAILPLPAHSTMLSLAALPQWLIFTPAHRCAVSLVMGLDLSCFPKPQLHSLPASAAP